MKYSGCDSLVATLTPRSRIIEAALEMVEQRVLALGTNLQSLMLLSAASYFIQVKKDLGSSSEWQKRIADHMVALLNKMCRTQERDSTVSNSPDNHLTQYVRLIQKTCETIGPGPDPAANMRNRDSLIMSVRSNPCFIERLDAVLADLERTKQNIPHLDEIEQMPGQMDNLDWTKLQMDDWDVSGLLDF
jgi:hypothetical protein